jgi:transposase-like protein
MSPLRASGPVDIRVPRDRRGSFVPKVVPKHHRHLGGFDDKVLAVEIRFRRRSERHAGYPVRIGRAMLGE